MKKAAVPSILVAVVLLAVASHSRGAAADESPTDRIPTLALHPLTGPHRGISPRAARAWLC